MHYIHKHKGTGFFFAPNNLTLSPPHWSYVEPLDRPCGTLDMMPPSPAPAVRVTIPLIGTTQGKSKRPKNFPL